MICKDMKYTALYWALRFKETTEDVYVKKYNGYPVVINAEAQMVDYGCQIKIMHQTMRYLKRHKDFVILECVDRLLQSGVSPADITLDGGDRAPDILVKGQKIFCEQWGSDYENSLSGFDQSVGMLYTSRLVSGLLEYRTSDMTFDIVEGDPDFEIANDELLLYKGREKIVNIPEGIRTIAASAFWNNDYIEEVVIPKSVEQIGGDSFYCCYNLKKICIPPRVSAMGNNPFAGCPLLELENESPHFKLVDGVLYDADGTVLIYYPIAAKRLKFEVPNGVTCIGKHSFFMCDALEEVVIPQSVIKLENNPFSGCTKLKITNYSSRYHIENGVIYNCFRSVIAGCLNGALIDKYIVPETVTTISRNAFWNCKGIRNVVITENVNRIGYNPFAGCEQLLLESKSLNFPCINGIIFDKNFSEIQCATDRAVGKMFEVPKGVLIIGRGAFSGCKSLKSVELNGVVSIGKSAFTNCTALADIYIPDSVAYIGEWAFAHCTALRHVSVSIKTFIDKNAFNECNVKISWRR